MFNRAREFVSRLPAAFRWGLIVAIALVASVFAYTDARAEPQLIAEAGIAIVRGETPSIALALVWPEAGPGDADYECGTRFIGESTFRGEPQRANFTWHCMLVAGFGPVDFGIGPAVLLNTDAYSSSQLAYSLLLRWRITARWHLTLDHHLSNGGTRPGNRGRDVAGLGLRSAF